MNAKGLGVLAVVLALTWGVLPVFAQDVGPPAHIIESTPSPAPELLINVIWVQRANMRDFARNYPPDALRRGIEGRVELECLVSSDGALTDCVVVSEEPSGHGFGAATINLSTQFRLAPQTSDGIATSGGKTRLPISWRTG